MTYPKYELEKMEKWELVLIIKVIDSRAPLSDETCDHPGITLGEAVFRTLHDMRQQSLDDLRQQLTVNEAAQ